MKLQSALPAVAAPAGIGDDPATALLDSLVGLAGERALTLGLDIEIMCGLIRRGCRSVTEAEPDDRPAPASVDMVIAPAIGTVATASQAVGHAKRGLTALGRVMVRTVRIPSDTLMRAIPDILQRHGFRVLAIRRAADRAAFVAALSPEPRAGA